MLPSATLPLSLNGRVDAAVWLTTMAVALLTAAIAGAMPALRASSVETMSILKDEALSTSGGLGKSRLTAGLVMAQMALSLVLLTCAGLFVRSLHAAQKTDIGFDPHHVLLATFDLKPMGYSREKGLVFEQDLLTRLRALPGVRAATLADFSPLNFTIHSDGVQPEGYVPRPHESMDADRGIVGPGYLATLRTPLLAGRDFTEADREGTERVAIVNQAMVDRYWPGQNALGNRIQFWGEWWTVVGVAGNGKYRRLIYDPTPLILVPLNQEYRSEVIVHLRVAGDPQTYTTAVERTVGGMNPDLPLYNVATLESNMHIGNVFERIAVDFAASFGLLALLLATVGLYGVVAYTTRQRTHEIGIRIALGAEKTAIFRDVVAKGLRLAAAGAAVGLVVSLLVTRFLRSLLFGVAADDLLTYAAVVLLLAVVAVAACYVPAWRATKVDPMAALRHE
jgi:predicted permease